LLEEYRRQIEELKMKIRELRYRLSQYEELLRETPAEPLIATRKSEEKSTVELIMDLLYEKYCTKPIIEIKSPKREKQVRADIII